MSLHGIMQTSSSWLAPRPRPRPSPRALQGRYTAAPAAFLRAQPCTRWGCSSKGRACAPSAGSSRGGDRYLSLEEEEEQEEEEASDSQEHFKVMQETKSERPILASVPCHAVQELCTGHCRYLLRMTSLLGCRQGPGHADAAD